MADKEDELKLIRMNEVGATEINWPWYPYILFGKITAIQGNLGNRKTTAVLAIAVAVTTGAALPKRTLNIYREAKAYPRKVP